MDANQLEKMLKMAADKLGMSPEQLKKAAESGNTQEILSHMEKSKADKVKQIMNDEKTMKTIFDSVNKGKI